MRIVPDYAPLQEFNGNHEPAGSADRNGDGRGDGGQFAKAAGPSNGGFLMATSTWSARHVEIFKNPSRRELAEIARSTARDSLAQSSYSLKGLMDPWDVYIWKGGGYHEDILEALTKETDEDVDKLAPVHISWDRRTNAIRVDLAENMPTSVDQSTILRWAKSHPALRGYTVLD